MNDDIDQVLDFVERLRKANIDELKKIKSDKVEWLALGKIEAYDTVINFIKFIKKANN